MFSLGDGNVSFARDRQSCEVLLSPEKQGIMKKVSNGDERYKSPRNVLELNTQNCAKPRQSFKDITLEKAMCKTPNDKIKISFGTPMQRPHSRINENQHVCKTENRIDFKNFSNKKASPAPYEFKTTNFQFSKKQTRHTRTKSQLTKESSANGKENEQTAQRPTRASENYDMPDPFQNIPQVLGKSPTNLFKKNSDRHTSPFSLKTQLSQASILTQKKSNNNAKIDSQQIPTFSRPLSDILTLTESIIIKTERQFELQQNLSLNQFIKGKRLGKGHFGEVFVVKHKITGFVCALKVISKEHIIQEKVTDQIIRELKIHSCLKHPNVIELYGFFADQKNLYILQQLCIDGQLWDLLKKRIRISEKYTAYIVRQLLQGLRYLHTNSVYHRDIKPENILMQNGIVKICDFGWAVHCMGMRNTRCGTPLYLSPEIVRGEAYDERVDIWGVGVMTYELITGSIPFKIYCEQDIKNIATDEVRFPPYLIISEHAKDFILKALNKDPKGRVSLVDLLFHPFLKDAHEMQDISESEKVSVN